MSTTMAWCLLLDHWKNPIGIIFEVQTALLDKVSNLTQTVKEKKNLTSPADDLVVWQCKAPKLLAEDEDDLEERLPNLDFSDKTKISKLSPSKKVVDLGLSEQEVLLVQVPPLVPCLLVDYWKKPIGSLFEVQTALLDKVSNLTQTVREKKNLTSPADDLVVWHCKAPKLLAEDEDDFEERLPNLDFSDKTKISKLSPSKRVVDLGLSEKEVLLVQVPPLVWLLLVDYWKKPIGNTFEVQMALLDKVSNLTQKVKAYFNDNGDPLTLPTKDLVVWHCKAPKLLAEDEVELEERLPNLDFSDKTKISKLSPSKKVVDLGLFEKEVLLVQLPYVYSTHDTATEQGHNNKRNYESSVEISNEIKQRKRNKLATDAPSFIAQPDQYEKIQQKPAERILDDRPEADSSIPPISLLYTPFGEFLDIFYEHKDINNVSEVDISSLSNAVDLLADEMSKFFKTEDDKRDKGLKWLNKIFGAHKYPGSSWEIYAASIGAARSDGHRNGSHSVTTMIAEFKLRICGISSSPNPQIVSYFAHSQSDALGSEKEELFYGWRIPCLGITIVDCEFRFYALLTLGPRFRIISLTPSISCIKGASDGLERKALRRAFIAASVLHARIDADINDRLSASSRVIHHDMVQPYIPAVTKVGALEIFELELWYSSQPYRYLYKAKTKDSESVLVKFIPQYSSELHRFCAVRGYAPALLAHERLPGGWYGVVMEYVPDTTPISLSESLKTYREEWKIQLTTLVASIHAEGLVHGDLRDANIICNDQGNVYLIDFDWGGKESIASYPTLNLHEELLEGRPNDGQLIITKADDLRVLNITFRKMDENVM